MPALPRIAVGCAVLACVATAPAARGDGDELDRKQVRALVLRLVHARDDDVAEIEAALRRAGGPAAAPLKKAIASSAGVAERRLKRVLALIADDWHRARVPPGMVYVPPGWVERSRVTRPWGPAGERTHVPGFYIDKTEVTVDDWRRWRKHLIQTNRLSRYRLPVIRDELPGTHPITNVSGRHARLFAREFRRGRLPRADEFARALRGSSVATWPWGDSYVPGRANLDDGLGPRRLVAVGSHPRGASPFGVLDLVGNVAEWSATFESRGSTRHQVPLALGGSFQDAPDPALTWRGRTRSRPQSDRGGLNWVGFRVVRDLERLPGD